MLKEKRESTTPVSFATMWPFQSPEMYFLWVGPSLFEPVAHLNLEPSYFPQFHLQELLEQPEEDLICYHKQL